MDKFATLEPVRLHSTGIARSSASVKGAVQKSPNVLIGRLPVDLHLLVLVHLPIPDFPAYSRCSRSTANIVRDEFVWEAKWKYLGVEHNNLGSVLEALEHNTKSSQAPETNPTFRSRYIRAHNLLKPCLSALSSPPHLILSTLSSTSASMSLRQQAKILHLISLFLSPRLQPVRAWETLYSSLQSAIDRFDASLLAAFDVADSKADEDGMREATESSWEIWDGVDDWEMGKVWAEKREIFYEQSIWKPLDNFKQGKVLDFDAMDEFMTHIISALTEHGSRAVRVFPPASQVLLSFSDRVASEVVGEYITPLLTHAREISNQVYLTAAAATFREAWRMVDVVMQVAGQRSDSVISRIQAEDVVYRMFEINMDEYLDEEVESLKQTLDTICRDWNNKTSRYTATSSAPDATRFLNSQNPAQVKRNVLASFTDVLLLPVTIVPRTMGVVGAALTTGGSAAVQGIAMLNPQRWVGGGAHGSVNGGANGYTKDFGQNGEEKGTLFEVGDDDDDDEPFGGKEKDSESLSRSSISSSKATLDVRSTAPTSIQSSPSRGSTPAPSAPTNQFELLLSLDTALELIHADRESLKRVETFADYPGHYGHRVHDTIEEIFILMLQAMNERHMSTGFGQATEQMMAYKPADHADTTSVAPLLQFFELVHVGDTIQSMVHVYFDKELAPHIDRTDFLNPVVREKKRFENSLDDCVAAGLNAGTEVLMNQVEHIIVTTTKPREYYPPEDTELDLGPTQGCLEVIKCLDVHCKLLKGSTSKEVLEVFYQEVGIRLIAILQKHIKRQIISLNGGFQVIADLNTYHSFVASLKVPNITEDFAHLKMLGHVFIVEDAKDLAQIVRDVTRYGGAYRPEDVYEFIQRRSDWKKIEKTVDKTMYNLSFKEDCIIC